MLQDEGSCSNSSDTNEMRNQVWCFLTLYFAKQACSDLSDNAVTCCEKMRRHLMAKEVTHQRFAT